MAEMGRGNRQTIENLSADISTFKTIVNEEIDAMRQEARSLRGDWDDEKYEEFLMYIETLASSLTSDLADLDNVIRNLNIILEKMG
jgi:hypothetical protein